MSDARLMHTVAFWLRDEAPESTPAEMAEFYNTSIRAVGGVEDVFVGRPAGTPRDVVDGTYHLLSSVVFRDAAAQDAWQVDPVHDEFRARFGPHFARVIVYDTLEQA